MSCTACYSFDIYSPVSLTAVIIPYHNFLLSLSLQTKPMLYKSKCVLTYVQSIKLIFYVWDLKNWLCH